MTVYFIHQEERGQWLTKIGRATDIRRRLGQLQTGNPKQLALVGWSSGDSPFNYKRRRSRDKWPVTGTAPEPGRSGANINTPR